MTDFALGGFAADNPLGYLAALGTLRTATLAVRDSVFQMSWELKNGHWQPQLWASIDIDRELLVNLLDKQLKANSHLTAFHLDDNLTIEITDYRDALLASQLSTSSEDRINADFLAAFGSDIIEAQKNRKPTGQIADTAFRTMNGAGHQHFLRTIRTFVEDTQPCHLESAIFKTWEYCDPLERHSMRWDPADDRRYALRWEDPAERSSKKTSGSVWGANRLAIESLALFPTQPCDGVLETTGFSKRHKGIVELTWPVWSSPINLSVVRSLLSLPQLQEEHPDRELLSSMGIVELFRSQRINQGKYRNFTTSNPVT